MDPTELWWLLSGNTPEKMYGKLTQNDVNEIIGDLRNHRLSQNERSAQSLTRGLHG